MHVGGTPLATHQRAERELEAERAGAHPVLTIAADFDVVQRELRRRQQAHFDIAVDAHVKADQTTCLGLEQRTMAAPVDHQRTDKRRYQR